MTRTSRTPEGKAADSKFSKKGTTAAAIGVGVIAVGGITYAGLHGSTNTHPKAQSHDDDNSSVSFVNVGSKHHHSHGKKDDFKSADNKKDAAKELNKDVQSILHSNEIAEAKAGTKNSSDGSNSSKGLQKDINSLLFGNKAAKEANNVASLLGMNKGSEGKEASGESPFVNAMRNQNKASQDLLNSFNNGNPIASAMNHTPAKSATAFMNPENGSNHNFEPAWHPTNHAPINPSPHFVGPHTSESHEPESIIPSRPASNTNTTPSVTPAPEPAHTTTPTATTAGGTTPTTSGTTNKPTTVIPSKPSNTTAPAASTNRNLR